MSNKISCVIITFNEEENIRKALNSVKWCDDIVVVDSGSKDKTIEICEEYNCRIYEKEFNGYGEQKRFAVSLASNDWILSIDADEVVSDELCDEIKKIFNDDEIKFNGFFLSRSLIFLGKYFKYGRESREYFLRLFNKNYGNFSSNKVHEKVKLKGDTQKLNGTLHHYSYTNIEQYFNKFNSYTTKAAQVLFDEGNKGRSVAAIVLGFPVYFFKNYFIYRNFLNGTQGFLWALFSSLYPVIKYFKLWALWNKK
ncbi:MAG: glycosyltransferase family 2 protein [Ignavibacteriaceae bacterium]